jgi:hypothetical protein
MLGTQARVAMFCYVVGLFGFGLYDIFARAAADLPSALTYGAQWPLFIIHLV